MRLPDPDAARGKKAWAPSLVRVERQPYRGDSRAGRGGVRRYRVDAGATDNRAPVCHERCGTRDHPRGGERVRLVAGSVGGLWSSRSCSVMSRTWGQGCAGSVQPLAHRTDRSVRLRAEGVRLAGRVDLCRSHLPASRDRSDLIAGSGSVPGTGSSSGASGWSLVSAPARSSICPRTKTDSTAPAAVHGPAVSQQRWAARLVLRRAWSNRILGAPSRRRFWSAAQPRCRIVPSRPQDASIGFAGEATCER